MKIKNILVSLSLFSTSVLAVQNGVTVERSNHQDTVYSQCTGTVIGGKWIITAAHCTSIGSQETVNTYDGKDITSIEVIQHPRYNSDQVDIALLRFNNQIGSNKTGIISQMTVSDGETSTYYGFGQTGNALNSAVIQKQTDPYPCAVQYTYADIGQGNAVSGDSGSSLRDSSNQIVAILKSTNVLGMYATKITEARDWILSTINGWNYPTQITGSGQKTITVQSLHTGGASDSSYTEGDLTIDFASSTCDDGVIAEYATCTYVVNNNGGHGKLFLTANEFIEFNKPTSTNSNPAPSGDSGGGSFGFLSLLGLAFLSLRKKA